MDPRPDAPLSGAVVRSVSGFRLEQEVVGVHGDWIEWGDYRALVSATALRIAVATVVEDGASDHPDLVHAPPEVLVRQWRATRSASEDWLPEAYSVRAGDPIRRPLRAPQATVWIGRSGTPPERYRVAEILDVLSPFVVPRDRRDASVVA